MKTSSFSSPQRGSVLIVVLLLAAIVAISLTSYLSLSNTALKLANRTFQGGASLNLTETGLEQAIWSFNKDTSGDPNAWDGWDTTVGGGSDARQKFEGFTYEQNTTGVVRVYIHDYKPTGNVKPMIVAESIITPPNGAPIKKMIQMELKRSTYFALGLVAKNSLKFSGANPLVDSWDSDPDNNPLTPSVPYNTLVAEENGSIGSLSVTGPIDVNNAKIKGTAAIGTSDPDDVNVGPQGFVGPTGTALGTYDPDSVTTDFSANLDPPTTPTATPIIPYGAINNTTTLPEVGHLPAADGKYYYQVSGISLNSKALNISANVVIIVDGYNVAIGGNTSGGINIATGSSLAVYTNGDFKVAGGGIANGGTDTATAQQPVNFQIWGTATDLAADQDISITGNGVLSGVVYAPYANLSITGGGADGIVLGSIVGNDITVTGNANFHYDESLADFVTDNPYRIQTWAELTSAGDRAVFASELDF